MLGGESAQMLLTLIIINISCASNQHSGIIFEESCDTEDTYHTHTQVTYKNMSTYSANPNPKPAL